MSESKDTGDTKLRLSGGSTLSLKGTAGSGRVRQSMSHGRSKTVVVEKKRKRILRPGEVAPTPVAPSPVAEVAPPPPAPAEVKPESEPTARRGSGVVLRTLTSDEKDARAHALAESRLREAEDRVRAKDDAAQRAIDEKLQKVEAEQAETRKADEADRRKNDEAEKARREEEARRRLETDVGDGNEETRRTADRKRGSTATPPPKTPSRRPAAGGRPRGKLTISNALNDQPRQRSLASMRRRIERGKKQARGTAQPQAKVMREVVIPEAITVQELANRMTERAVDVVRLLMQQGHMLTSEDVIDADMAQLITEEMGHTVRRVAEADVEVGLHADNDEEEDLLPRAPIVTVMGHVDHGKTSMLDALRSSDVVGGEAGGITQHIGAYQVAVPSGDKVTFIDTPGHAAFTAMRARGSKITDLVILVVAADDGVMPQTVEAINHARAADVPIIVAINKMDLPDAEPTRVRNELLQHEIVVESLGGETMEFEISAIKKTGLDKLIEGILLQAEVLELKANPNRAGDGAVIEAKLDRGRGPVATVLVQRGKIRVGDIVVAGAEYGRVRALINDRGENVREAGPSVPVEILGLNGAPGAGDQFSVVENEARAREISEYRQRLHRDRQMVGTGVRASLEQMMTQISEAGRKEVAVVIKGDVQGSVEAIVGALENLNTDEVFAQTVHQGVGGITESDVALASASGAAILAFNVRANAQARAAAEVEGVEIRYYSVIYNLIDDVKAAMSGLLDPELRETFLGNAVILQVFNITKVGKVAGCNVTEGVVRRGSHVRLIRDEVVIHEGTLGMLKRFKDEVKEVISGQECGMSFEKYHDLKEGDVIECFDVEKVERTL